MNTSTSASCATSTNLVVKMNDSSLEYHVNEEVRDLQFLRHLRSSHCSKEGGSYVCRYGYNGVCSSLPLEGVSDKDYEDHVVKHHTLTMYNKGSSGSMVSGGRQVREEKWGVYSSTQNVVAVLNDPRKGMKRDFFTKTWGESFVEVKEIPPHVALPEVTTRHVESYVRRLRKRQKLLQRLAALEAAKETQEKETSLGPSERVGEEMLGATDEIPAIFLSGSFSLEDPETFHSVFTHITDQGICQKNAKHLQERIFSGLESSEKERGREKSRKIRTFRLGKICIITRYKRIEACHAITSLRRCIGKLKHEHLTSLFSKNHVPGRKDNLWEVFGRLKIFNHFKEKKTPKKEINPKHHYIIFLNFISKTKNKFATGLAKKQMFCGLGFGLNEYGKICDWISLRKFVKYDS
ncbi:unnamed protein product, partial [Meganyctiphanes norvegica]